MDTTSIKLITFNCKGAKRSQQCINNLCSMADIVAIQETWLLSHDIPWLGDIHEEFSYTGKSAVDTSKGILKGRPYGGVGILWRKSVFNVVNLVPCKSDRLIAIKITLANKEILIFSIYMPTDANENLIEFTNCLGEIVSIIDNCGIETVFMLGDFNAHPNQLFAVEMNNFCDNQSWICADMKVLGEGSDTYTFVSDAHGCRRWLDHCLVTEAAWSSIVNVRVIQDVYWSDHLPVAVECNLDLIKPKKIVTSKSFNKVIWGDRNKKQIDMYEQICNSKLRLIDFPSELRSCADNDCNDASHKRVIDELYRDIVKSMTVAATLSRDCREARKGGYVPGWNQYVRDSHWEARTHFKRWVQEGKPFSGPVWKAMTESRQTFKKNLKCLQNNREQVKMDVLVTHHDNKSFKQFWKQTKKLNPKTSLPVSVEGKVEAVDIANVFKEHFQTDRKSVV